MPEPTRPDAPGMRGEDVPQSVLDAAHGGYSMHGAGLVANLIAAAWPEITRQVREQAAAEILALWPPYDPEDYEFVHAVTDYLRGICHVCNEPITGEPCTPRHADLARGKRGQS